MASLVGTPQLQALLALGAAAIASGWGFVQWRRARSFADTPTSRARSAAQGYAAFSGIARAQPGDALRAPLSGRACLWYEYKVEERSNERDNPWRTLEHGTSDDTFSIDDGTGELVIDPEGADVTGLPRTRWYANAPRDPPGLATWHWLGALVCRYRCTEWLVADGQMLAAVGQYRTQRVRDDAGSIDQETALRLGLWKRDPQRMAQVDRNHDGAVSQAEWELARQDAREEVARELREQSARPGVSLLQKPADGRPFLFGAGDAAGVARRYRARALAALAAAMVLLAIGVHRLAA